MEIREFNKRAYLRILKEMEGKKNGAFIFTITINAKNIVDYTTVEEVKYKKDGSGESTSRRPDLTRVLEVVGK